MRQADNILFIQHYFEITVYFIANRSDLRSHYLIDGQQPKDELIPTRATLIQRLKNWQDQSSWQDFFDTYWKLIYGTAIKSGLTATEAQDVVQETMISVAKHMPAFKYDPAIGSFKTWLLNMTRWRITDQLRKRGPFVRASHSARRRHRHRHPHGGQSD